MRDLRDIVSALLAREGALVESLDPDGLEAIVPEPLQKKLAVPEMFRLGFGVTLPEHAQRVTLESDWLERLERLLANRGASLQLTVAKSAATRFSHDVDRMVQRELVFDNATYRTTEVVEARTRYLLFSFKVTAISDEKREDLLHLCVNESNRAIADHLVAPLHHFVTTAPAMAPVALPEDKELPIPWNGPAMTDFFRRLLPHRIRQRLAPFLVAMERRMQRDLERIHVYCTDLHREAAARLAEKTAKGQDAQALEHERRRLASIEREFHTKLDDIRRKYQIAVEAIPVQRVQIALPVLRCRLLLLRRKGSRPFHLDLNPLSRKMDAVACEVCGATAPPYALCDEALHLVCPACRTPCAQCGKSWCRACSAACPQGH